jgi:hypothetical protein
MTVAELIQRLQALPQDVQVVVPLWSEQCLLEDDQVGTTTGGEARPDGWVHDVRPDKRTVTYVQIG